MPQPSIQFEEFELDVESCELRRSGHPLRLERIPMELLILLLQNPGRLVRRQTIEQSLWGEGTFLEAEHSINTAVNKLRATLRDDSRDPRFIRTVIGQGYKFIAAVKIPEPFESDRADLSHASASLALPVGATSMTVDTKEVGDGQHADSGASDGGTPSRQVATIDPTSSQAPAQAPRKSSATWLISGSVGSLAILLTVFATLHFLHAPPKTSPLPEPASGFHSIAVLPFRNLAQNDHENYLVDGMTDQLISDLAMNTPVRVISHQSVMQYKDVQLSLPEIAKALNADAIVEGSYLRRGNEIRITAQLLDARNDRHLWAQTYRESDRNPLAIQDQVTHDIARQIALVFGSAFIRPKSQNVNEAARNAYLWGRYLWNERTPSGLTKSIQYYTDAIHADRDYAEAYAALSESYLALSSYGDDDPTAALWKAQFAAERALALDSNLSSAHTALAGVKIERDWDWRGAEKEYRRAIAIDPSDSTAHHWYGLHLVRMGRGHEGLAELQHALSVDPLSLIIATDVAETYYLMRNYSEAMGRIDNVLALNPNFAQAHLVKGKILAQMGRYSESEQEFIVSDHLFGKHSWSNVEVAQIMALEGKHDEATRMVHQLEELSTKHYISGIHLARIYCALHQNDKAMSWLERAYMQHDSGLNIIGVEPLFDNCRADSRFQDLVRRLRLSK